MKSDTSEALENVADNEIVIREDEGFVYVEKDIEQFVDEVHEEESLENDLNQRQEDIEGTGNEDDYVKNCILS